MSWCWSCAQSAPKTSGALPKGRDNDSVLTSHKTTHKDTAVTFVSYNAYEMAIKGT